MIVNQFFWNSPSLQADSTIISFFHHQHPISPPSHSRCQMDNGYYFMLIVGITMQITKINGFYSIPKMIQVIIHPNSEFRSSPGLEIADKNGQFRTGFLDLKLVRNETKLTKTKSPKQSLKCHLNINEVFTRFPVVLRKESRHSESERAMSSVIGTQDSGPYGRQRWD